MLDEFESEKIVERLIRRIEQANTYFLMSIGSSIKKIRDLTPSKAEQLIQILKYGGNYEEIINQIAKYLKMNVADVDDIFSNYAKRDLNFYEKFYKYRNIPFIPFEENTAIKMQTEALSKVVKNEMYNFTRRNVLGYTINDVLPNGKRGKAQFYGLRETYNRVLDEAMLNIGQGKESFNSSMKRIMEDLGGSGLKTIVYDSAYLDKDGIQRNRVRRLDSVVRMNLQGRLSELHTENQKIIGEQIGADGVEITTHSNPAPDHQYAQGRQFTNEEFDKLQLTGKAKTVDGIEINMHITRKDGSEVDTHRPIGEMNCYHDIYAIVLGVDEPEHTNKELQEIIDKNNKGFDYDGKHYNMYEGTQLQRRIETEIRKQKDIQILSKASDNEEMVNQSQEKINQLTRKYKELSDVSGLPMKLDRIQVNGYRKTKI